MSRNNLGLVGAVVGLSTPKLVQGSDVYVVTQIRYQGSENPYAFQGFVGATASFSAADGTHVNSIGVIENAELGICKFSLPPSGSLLLLSGDELSFQQAFVDARGSTTIIFDGGIDVAESLY